MVIAIDGPAGSGKSTTARMVAKRLGFLYLDTGAMYRALTLKALRERLDLENEEALGILADRTQVALVQRDEGLQTLLDGEDVSEEIRLPEVTAKIAPVCRVPRVREVLVQRQREIGQAAGDVVMEGRDIGTVVFPDAQLKIFLDAGVEERARRRFGELAKQGIEAHLEDVKRDMLERDQRDMEREHGPLRRAKDVVVVDTTHLTIAEQVDRIVRLARENG
ncbi:MAG: (d)CMP kinase [Candidatus Latescibacterota bacterium]